MKKLTALRAELKAKHGHKRGFTMIETVLVLAVGLSMIVGGLVYYMQADASAVMSDKTRLAVAISTEVRSQARTLESFNNLAASTAVADGASVKAFVMNNSAIPAGQFANVDIIANGQSFDLELDGLSEKVCNRLAISDLGPNSTPDGASCSTGDLTITYTR